MKLIFHFYIDGKIKQYYLNVLLTAQINEAIIFKSYFET